MPKQKLKERFKESSKVSITVYFVLRFLVILCMIREIILGNIWNAILCILSLFLLVLPIFFQKKFKIDLPDALEVLIFLFIFSAEILGEINNFYGLFTNFDTILHTINGFLCAAIGFSLINLLNEKVDTFNLSPIFVALVAFCFSMTVGVVWEFYEYAADHILSIDMQKDTIVNQISSVTFDLNNSNQVYSIGPIDKTIMLDEKGAPLYELDGYLDIGLNDTMQDLFVNFLGAFVFSILGYLYLKNGKKFKVIKHFIPRKKEG